MSRLCHAYSTLPSCTANTIHIKKKKIVCLIKRFGTIFNQMSLKAE